MTDDDIKNAIQPRKSKLPVWAWALIFGFLGLIIIIPFVFGVASALFGSSMGSYKLKAAQTEAQINVKAVGTACVLYWEENPATATTAGEPPVFTPPKELSEMALTLSAGRNYTVQLGEAVDLADKPNNADKSDVLKRCDDIAGAGKTFFDEKGFRALACGNLDDDPTIDVWALESENKRPKQPINVVDDVKK